MCTAATYQTRDFYFGRTLDYEFSYGDEVTITPRGIYYYTTYENRQITAVDMHRENLNGSALIRYPLITEQQIAHQN